MRFSILLILIISTSLFLKAQSLEPMFSERHKARAWNNQTDFKLKLNNGNILVVHSFIKGSAKQEMNYDFIVYDDKLNPVSKHAYNNVGARILNMQELDNGQVNIYELITIDRRNYKLRVKTLNVETFTFDNDLVSRVNMNNFQWGIEIRKKPFSLISGSLYNAVVFSEDKSKWAFIYSVKNFGGSILTKIELFDSDNMKLNDWTEENIEADEFIDQALLTNEGLLFVKWLDLYKKNPIPKYYFFKEKGIERFLANQVCYRCLNFNVSLENGVFHFIDLDVNRRGALKSKGADDNILEFDVEQDQLTARNIRRWNIGDTEFIGNEKNFSFRNAQFHSDYTLSSGDRIVLASTNINSTEFQIEGQKTYGIVTVYLIYKLSKDGKVVWGRNIRQKHTPITDDRFNDQIHEFIYRDSLVLISKFTDAYLKDDRFFLDSYAKSYSLYAHFIAPDASIRTQEINVGAIQDDNLAHGSLGRLDENHYFLELNNEAHSKFTHMLLKLK